MGSRLMLLVAMGCCMVAAGHADETSHAAKVHEFFKVAKLDQLSTQIMTQAMAQVNSAMMQQLLGVGLTPEQQQSADQLKGKVADVLNGALGWEKLEPEYTRMYSEAFSEQQMDDILAFYKSSTGQAMIDKSSTLLTKSSKIAQRRMADAMPQIEKLVKDFTEQQMGKSKRAP